MPYDRWHRTEADAIELTGVAGLTQADLEAAEEDLVDLIGWRPNVSSYSTAVDAVTGHPTDRRVEAFGKAVAWQAAHRAGTTAKPDDQAVRVSSESVAEWSSSYRGGRLDDPIIGARARRLLVRGGWLARSNAAITLP